MRNLVVNCQGSVIPTGLLGTDLVDYCTWLLRFLQNDRKTGNASGPVPLDIQAHKTYFVFMSATAVIKNHDFQLITEFAKPDSKKRLSLGEALSAGAFNIYRNALGQLVLDPVKTIPASEAWLFENPQALASVKQGLKEAALGKTTYLGSFAQHAKSTKA